MVRFLFIIMFTLLLVSGCAPPRMSVSNELKANNDEYVVKGKNGTRIRQKMSFGNYYTTNIHRSWIKGNGYRNGIGYGGTGSQEWVNIISTEYINKKQTIRFNLTNGKEISDVYCVARFNSRDLQIGKNPNSLLNIGMDIAGIGDHLSSTYYVQIYAGEKDERPWEMMIDNQMSQAKPGEYIGWLAKSWTEYFVIVPVTKMELNGKIGTIPAGSVGFEFRTSDGKPVAAVSLMEKGMVFLGKVDEKTRFLLANACTAFLLEDVIE